MNFPSNDDDDDDAILILVIKEKVNMCRTSLIHSKCSKRLLIFKDEMTAPVLGPSVAIDH